MAGRLYVQLFFNGLRKSYFPPASMRGDYCFEMEAPKMSVHRLWWHLLDYWKMADSKCVLMGKWLKHKYAKNCLHCSSLSRLRSLHFTQNETTRLYSRISLVILPREPLGPVYTHADISLLIRNLCFGYLKKKEVPEEYKSLEIVIRDESRGAGILGQNSWPHNRRTPLPVVPSGNFSYSWT